MKKGAEVGKPIVPCSGDGVGRLQDGSRESRKKLVSVDQGMKVCACWCTSSYVTDKLYDLSNTLLAVKVAEADSAEAFGGIDNFSWKVRLKPILDRVILRVCLSTSYKEGLSM